MKKQKLTQRRRVRRAAQKGKRRIRFEKAFLTGWPRMPGNSSCYHTRAENLPPPMTPSPKTYRPDYAVVGSGVAGLRAAIELSTAGSVLVLAKADLSESATAYAQGGIAVALSDEDEIGLHEQDTINAGDGLCRPESVALLVEVGPKYITELIEWGLTAREPNWRSRAKRPIAGREFCMRMETRRGGRSAGRFWRGPTAFRTCTCGRTRLPRN